MSSVLLVGDYSGNNAGDNALLLGIVHELRRAGVSRMLVPTLQPWKLRHVLRSEGGVEAVGMAPWHLSLKLLGPRLLSLVRGVDALLLTDNQFYDSRWWNPITNNLVTLEALTAWAGRVGTPCACYAGGAGPLSGRVGRVLVSRIARRARMVQLRDDDARRRLETLLPEKELRVTADAVFGLDWECLGPVPDRSVAPPSSDAEPGGRKVVAVNLSVRSRGPGGKGARGRLGTATARRLVELLARERDLEVVLLVTHPRDLSVARAIAAGSTSSVKIVALGAQGFRTSISALVERVHCLVSDRYHEIAAFASAGVPVVAWAPDDKIRALLARLDCGDHVIESPVAASEAHVERLRNVMARDRAKLTRRTDALRTTLREGTAELLRAVGLEGSGGSGPGRIGGG